jgi:hypothetical protein
MKAGMVKKITMPTLTVSSSLKTPPPLPPGIINHGQDLMAHVVVTRAYAWTHSIVIQVGAKLLQQAHAFAVERAARCVSIFLYFDAADIMVL